MTAATAVELPTLALGLREVIRLLRAGSYAHVLQSKTKLEWVKDPGRIQNVYGALCGLFGTPGTAEVVFPDMTRAEDEVRRLTADRIDVFFDKCLLGPAAAGAYLKAMDELRIHSLTALRETVGDQMAINRGIAQAWGVSIEYLADVHLVSTLLVKAGGAVLPGPASMIDFGYDIAVSTVPDLFNPGRAKAVAFVTEAAKETGEEIASWSGEKIVDAINKRSTETELQQAYRRLRDAESKLSTTIEKIIERRQELASGVSPHKALQSLRQLEPRVARYAQHLDVAQKGIAKSGALRVAAKAVSFIFLAKDVMDAFEKHTQTVAAARL